MNKREFLSKLTKSTALIASGLALAAKAKDPQIIIRTDSPAPQLYINYEKN